MNPVIGITISTPGYHDLATEAAARWRRFAGAEALILSSDNRETSHDLKFRILDLVGDRTVVFFDADWWAVAKLDVGQFYNTGSIHAVKDASRHSLNSFCLPDAVALGFDPDLYVNTGLFVCNGRDARHREAFGIATSQMAIKRAGGLPAVRDVTEQSILNAAWHNNGIPMAFLPDEWNYWPRALARGFCAVPPKRPLAIHAADVPLTEKMAFLRQWTGFYDSAAWQTLAPHI